MHGVPASVLQKRENILHCVPPYALVWIAYFLCDADTPGHKIFGLADTPLRTRFPVDGRKSFLPSTCMQGGTAISSLIASMHMVDALTVSQISREPPSI